MALVKLVRDLPEVKGGKTEGMFPEEVVADLKKRGWKAADKTSEKKEFPEPEPVITEPAKEDPKEIVESEVESDVEELKEEPKVEEHKNEYKYSKR